MLIRWLWTCVVWVSVFDFEPLHSKRKKKRRKIRFIYLAIYHTTLKSWVSKLILIIIFYFDKESYVLCTAYSYIPSILICNHSNFLLTFNSFFNNFISIPNLITISLFILFYFFYCTSPDQFILHGPYNKSGIVINFSSSIIF